MRIIVVEPQKKIECGICKAEGKWIRKIEIRGIQAIYCLKCDTVTMYNKMPSKYFSRALKQETDKIKIEHSMQQISKEK